MRIMKLTLVLCFLLLFNATLPGCNQATPTGTSGTANTQASQSTARARTPLIAVNTICPIMGGAVSMDGGTAEWNDKQIGFCCPECVPEWTKLSDDQKTSKLAAAQVKGESDTTHADHDQ